MEAVGYYKAALGAVERYRLEDDAGKVVVAQLAIEGADFWLQEDVNSSPDSLGRRAVFNCPKPPVSPALHARASGRS